MGFLWTQLDRPASAPTVDQFSSWTFCQTLAPPTPQNQFVKLEKRRVFVNDVYPLMFEFEDYRRAARKKDQIQRGTIKQQIHIFRSTPCWTDALGPNRVIKSELHRENRDAWTRSG